MHKTGKAARAARIIAVKAIAAGTVVTLLSGCGAVQPVAPWEKGMLAQPNMRFERGRNEARYAAHMYDSREAASGAGSVGGGGCGCN